MRTHYLRDLQIAGRDEVLATWHDFDLYRLSRVVYICVSLNEDGLSANISMSVLYDAHIAASCGKIIFHFRGCRWAKVPELSPLFFLNELEIEDVRGHQLEGIHFKVKNFGMTSFEIHCADILVEGARHPSVE
jgi:hypothetical protein